MDKQELLQKLGEKVVEGYFENREEFDKAKQEYLSLRKELESLGEPISYDINFKSLPTPNFN